MRTTNACTQNNTGTLHERKLSGAYPGVGGVQAIHMTFRLQVGKEPNLTRHPRTTGFLVTPLQFLTIMHTTARLMYVAMLHHTCN